MENKEKELLDKVKSEVTSIVDGKVKATESTIENFKSELSKLDNSKDVAAIKTELANISAQLKAEKEASVSSKESKKSFAENLVDGFLKLAKADGTMDKIKGGQRVALEIKAAGTMSTSNVDAVGTGSIPFSLSAYESGLTRIQRRNPFILQLTNTGSINAMYYNWAEQENPDPGVAGMVAEGGAKPATDFDWVEKSAQVRKVAVSAKASKEILSDLSAFESELRNELTELVLLKMDEQILAGDGTGQNLTGILSFAQTWAAGSFALSIENANNFDVIRVAINQIEKENFYPTYIVMHPTDAAAMDMAKDSTGQYVMPPFITAGGNTIKGLPVITNTGVTEGTFLVGDFTKANVKVRENVNISMGYENDDFTKNLITFICEMRGLAFVKTNHVKAFVKGTFSTAVTALEKP